MQETTSLKDLLQRLEEKLLKPEVRSSITDLEELLSDEFLEFGSSGNIYTKQDCLNGLALSKMTLHDFELKQLSEDTVLTTYRIFNETRELHTLRSSIWKLTSGKWQMFFHQGTPTKG
ncbi:DUF4440 domain-containing protein [Metabacillus herbersteinensis]|uniref:DUF4440 domain-containing protein n=1 Tax=Metabacillus herbersteinensis TaxID=283816 RepID=A0ABV6G9M1_9BACI